MTSWIFKIRIAVLIALFVDLFITLINWHPLKCIHWYPLSKPCVVQHLTTKLLIELIYHFQFHWLTLLYYASHKISRVIWNINLVEYSFFDRADCTVPTLEEVIEFAIHKDIILLLDVKGGSHCRKVHRFIETLQPIDSCGSKRHELCIKYNIIVSITSKFTLTRHYLH